MNRLRISWGGLPFGTEEVSWFLPHLVLPSNQTNPMTIGLKIPEGI